MRSRPLTFALVGLISASIIIPPTATAQENSESSSRFIVSYHPGTYSNEEERVDAFASVAGSSRELRETATGASVMETDRAYSEEESKELIDDLTQDPAVEYAEVDALLTTSAPNDPYFSQQWSMNAIDAVRAWDTADGRGTTVAVLDTGITNHPDLSTTGGWDFVSDPQRARDGNGRDSNPRDEGDWTNPGECGTRNSTPSSWHGTHVAGTIGATANNRQGVAGVAPATTVTPIRVLGACGGYLSDISDGLMWAAGASVAGTGRNNNPADVINMSLGGSGACSTTYQRAINWADARNVTVVAAAGNEGRDASLSQPANCDNTIAVGATDSRGNIASYSNRGSTVDVWAPGSNIISTVNQGRTTPTNPGYANQSGTSMAAPHVAGIVAMIKQRHPQASNDEITQRLQNSGRVVNAVRALEG